MIIGKGIPRTVGLDRAGGFAAIGVAQVRKDAAVLSLELLDRVEGAGGQAGHPRVQSTAGDEQQRKAGTGLLIADANGAFFVEARASSSFPLVLSKPALRGGHRRGARRQYVASCRIHNRQPPCASIVA